MFCQLEFQRQGSYLFHVNYELHNVLLNYNHLHMEDILSVYCVKCPEVINLALNCIALIWKL